MIVLVRIDERLIHGQVVAAWAPTLNPTSYEVVDDGVAESDWEAELVLAGVPDECVGNVFTTVEATERWPVWSADEQRRFVLVSEPQTLVKLVESGAGLDRINVGGLHARPGRKEYAAYVHLDPDELSACRALCAAGIALEGQDVPMARMIALCGVIAEGSD